MVGFGPTSGFGAGVGPRVGCVTGAVVHPLIQAPAARVHKEVADCGQLQAQLLGDGELQLFGWALVLLEDGMERPPLHVREHQPGLLGHAAPLAPAVVLFLTLTGCRDMERTRQEHVLRGADSRKKSRNMIKVSLYLKVAKCK